jgi:hypothetical protein
MFLPNINNLCDGIGGQPYSDQLLGNIHLELAIVPNHRNC